MRPLRIDISLRTYMRSPEHLIHLDSILHELIAARMEVRSDAPEAQDEITRRLDKVLARDESDPERVYCASALMFSGSSSALRKPSFVKHPSAILQKTSCQAFSAVEPCRSKQHPAASEISLSAPRCRGRNRSTPSASPMRPL